MVPDGSPKPGTEEFRKAKEGINKEGWEDNAAVIIGTKEELAQRREQLEKGRETVDLRTYIHRNAFPEATSVEIMDDNNNVISKGTKEMWEKIPVGAYVLHCLRLRFKSSKGDIKSVLIEPKEIAEMAEFGERFNNRNDAMKWSDYEHFMSREVEKLGFTPAEHEGALIDGLVDAIKRYRDEKSQEEKKGKGFEF